MKLRKEFLLHNTGNESILVPTGAAGFSGVMRGNRSLGAILEMLRTDTDEAALVSAMKARFEAPEGAIEADVKKALAELRGIGALDE
jgi:hypothetical protein